MRAAPSLFARTKISRPKQQPQRNIIAALAFAPFLSSLCPLMAASPRQSALGRFAPHASGRPSSWPE